MKRKRFSSQLNTVIAFQKKAVSGKGIDRAKKWEGFCQVWASIRPVSASEIIKSNREEMNITHRIKIRYMSGLSSDMRIVFGTRKFDINSIININEASREIEILAVEVA